MTEPAKSIGKMGFHKWYEWRLIEGHAWLVSCLLCAFAVFACLEALSFRGSIGRLLVLGISMFGAGAVAGFSLLRYLQIMVQVQRIGEHSTCAGCGTHGRFSMLTQSMAKCRKCGNEWRLID
jgi:hypothetical protein